MVKKIIIFLLCTNFFCLDAKAEQEKPGESLIRVLLLKDVSNLSLSVRCNYDIVSVQSKSVIQKGKSINKNTVRVSDNGIKIGSLKFNEQAIEIRPVKSGYIYVNNRRYRGNLRVIKTKDNKITAINVLGIEDYLKGVLKQEVNNKWPIAVLHAQAIAARAYAFYQKEVSQSQAFDVTASVLSQVYGGMYSETWKTNKAVTDTKGQILTFEDKIFPAYYHACCGGHTEDAGILWNVNIEPLRGRVCDFCSDSPHFSWIRTIKLNEAEAKLNKNGFKINSIKQIDIAERSESGRITTLKITDAESEKYILSKEFRQFLGSDLIRSTNFSIEINNDTAIIKGLGWGHGVGLCQWGAYRMASSGYSYEEILYFYYPNSKIKKLY